MGKRAKKGVTVADLKPGQAYGFLYCDVCGQECSADTGDYWNLPSDYVFTCGHGGEESSYPDHAETNMRLVRRETRLVGVR
jgi:hypothetical protein